VLGTSAAVAAALVRAAACTAYNSTAGEKLSQDCYTRSNAPSRHVHERYNSEGLVLTTLWHLKKRVCVQICIQFCDCMRFCTLRVVHTVRLWAMSWSRTIEMAASVLAMTVPGML